MQITNHALFVEYKTLHNLCKYIAENINLYLVRIDNYTKNVCSIEKLPCKNTLK